MNVEIVKKNQPSISAMVVHSCLQESWKERKYLIVIKIKWYSYDPTFFKIKFFTIKMSIDEIQVVIKSACYSMLLILLYR